MDNNIDSIKNEIHTVNQCRVLETFANELNMIHDRQLREFAEYMLINADDYFYTIPASTSGKHHPTFDLGDRGLVRHTKVVTFIANSLALTHQLDAIESDIVTIAALVHDIKKCGHIDENTNINDLHTVSHHPALGYAYVISKAHEYFTDDDYNKHFTTIDKISQCVLSHMGQWGNVLPSSLLQHIVHDADYIASRKEFTGFEFK